jgi:hypothetical protein
MTKWLVVLLGLVGCFFLINAYIPGAWSTAFVLPIGKGLPVAWAVLVMGGVLIVGARLKSK